MGDLLEDLLERHPHLREVAEREKAHVNELLAENAHGYREGLRAAQRTVWAEREEMVRSAEGFRSSGDVPSAGLCSAGAVSCYRVWVALRDAIDADEEDRRG